MGGGRPSAWTSPPLPPAPPVPAPRHAVVGGGEWPPRRLSLPSWTASTSGLRPHGPFVRGIARFCSSGVAQVAGARSWAPSGGDGLSTRAFLSPAAAATGCGGVERRCWSQRVAARLRRHLCASHIYVCATEQLEGAQCFGGAGKW
ncbi:hypothetical protein I4F81_005971 [Pyropia yezoensis]|uniref:Uncharacterized protein n=1 Tax=Pyropia yezoensis TaxID=2788 RepID=A0ACC3BZL2_PYRYE|nr:hypothetical protein I4F81_005971 [Neopyropia yezoensis]